jgi:hypothetical protein
MNGVVKSISALSIETTGQLVVMTKGQNTLLQLIRDCVKNKAVLGWDLIVEAYYNNVRKTYVDKWYLRYHDQTREYDVMQEYKNQSSTWTYVLRPMVRQWLVSNIGILVLKNQLVIIPTIDIGEA